MANEQCCANAPTLSSTCGAGHVEEFGGLKTYISGRSDSKLAILLVSDVFGYEAPNLRMLADKCAAAGYLVVVPDFLHGDPFDKSNPNRTFQAWSDAHPIDKVTETAISVVEALKAKGVSTIGSAGFCWGAKVVVKLGHHPYINAAVLLHPSFVTLDEILAVKVPISILGAENDQISPPELLKQFGKALEAKKEVDCFLKIFPGVSHGWTVKYPSDDEEAVKRAAEAHQDMLDWSAAWFKSTVVMKLIIPAICCIMCCPQCCENPPVLSSSRGIGHEEEIGGLKCCVIGSPDSKPAVVLASDIFGPYYPTHILISQLRDANYPILKVMMLRVRKLADKVAAFGFYVVVPDFFYGDPYIENLERPLLVYMIDHLPVVNVGKLEMKQYWSSAVEVPISILGAEIDPISPPQLLKKFAEVLKAKPEVDGFVKIFPGARHGWTVWYKDEDAVAVKLADEAHKDMVDWFVKYVQ
ncbi:hypothetical protein RHSIM_Rhsim04G0208300 [Rhododendron simsii]|uniref:Dienelactone hydrolase domain-containing protein n=1 Tax=Rhododendron simsii TaxID=118357 RepID=A0A834LQ79_RHOSS|nr:hypothetical protein RHSIM_Rhsim04G0208300 [Rhododendron simsii]